ncbi:MAG TPA: gliding motility-associated C-terminal domain-containing protein, partial [Bacteroidales bacterium]|nr:gliding motility-associated C-terminal domain-containing protein [Bacteroidales bacterium]
TAGDYNVTITSLDGCTSTFYCHLIESSLPVINFSDTIICPGQLLTLDAGNPGSSYIWSTGASTQILDIAAPGNYSITVTDINNCSNIANFKVTLLLYPELDLGDDMILCEMKPIVIDAGNNYNITEYIWNTGEITRSIKVYDPGIYSVTITNACGSNSDSIFIAVDDTCSWVIFIPNAFTPNGDGDNDVFRTFGSENIIDFNMKIFNRWGEMLFQSNNINTGWNGKYEGEIQPNGVYTYIITFQVRGRDIIQNRFGKVLLLR